MCLQLVMVLINGHFKTSDSLSLYFVEDPITCSSHRGYVVESIIKDDICSLEIKLYILIYYN